MRHLQKRPLHILVPTILSVAIAIFAFLVVMGMKDGVTRQLDKVMAENDPGTKRVVVRHNGRRITPTDLQFELLSQIPGFRGVAGETMGWMAAPEEERYMFRGLGVTHAFFSIRGFPLESGRYFTEEEVEWGIPVMVIGAEVRQKLFSNQNPLGQTIRHYGVDYTVVGTLRKVQEERGFEASTNIMVFCPYTAINNIPVGGRLSQFWVNSGSLSVKATGNLIRQYKVFPESVELDILPQNQIWAHFFHQKNQVLALLVVISLVIMILAGLNVMMVSLASVNQRLYEIGVKKAVGAAGERIFLDLVKETLVLFFLGGLAGVGCFYLLRYPIERVIRESILPGARVFGMGGIMLLAIGFLVSLYPAYIGAQLTPLQALYRRGGLVSRLKKDVSRRIFVVMGIVLSIIAITMISMVSGGYLQQIDALTAIFSEDLLFIKQTYDVPADFLQPPEITRELYEALHTGVTDIAAITWASIRYGESVEVNGEEYSITIYDVEEKFFEVMKLEIAEGRNFSQTDEIVMGAQVADFFKGQEETGFIIDGETYRISGVLAGVPMEVGGLRRFDYGSYIFKKATQEAYTGREYNHEILIRVQDPANLEAVITQINTIAKRLAPDKGNVSLVRPLLDHLKYREQMERVRLVCLLYAILGLFVSGIGTMNLMLVYVGTRAKEIGICRVVGASRIAVGYMLLKESIFLTGLGGLIGMVAGLFCAFYLANYFALEFYLSPSQLVPALMCSVGTGLVAGLYPALRASSVKPLAVLKPVGE